MSTQCLSVHSRIAIGMDLERDFELSLLWFQCHQSIVVCGAARSGAASWHWCDEARARKRRSEPESRSAHYNLTSDQHVSMSRLPPGLLYLTIYNPTLRPDASVQSDDEDAEEQAHILFYTARERAVSRDKILRQVGLAKALINFSGYVRDASVRIISLMDTYVRMFDGDDTCENVHSQSRRMVMVSPEPDFWIHAVSMIVQLRRMLPDLTI